MSDEFDERVALTPRAAQIAQVARVLLERNGAERASMRAIAGQLGIKAASLYEHFTGKRALHSAIAAAGLHELADEISEQVANGAEPRPAGVAETIRDYACRHPNLYRLITAGDLDPNDPNLSAAQKRLYAHAPSIQDPRATAALVLAHGITDLHRTARCPPGPATDAAWQAGLHALTQPADPGRATDQHPQR